MMAETIKTERKATLSRFEIFWIALDGTIALGGLFMVVLGIIGDYLPVKASDNWILSGETSFESAIHLSFRWFGVIILIVAAFIAVLFLNYFAKKSDIDQERAVRRQQRLQVISASDEVKKEAPIEATEVSSTPKATDYNLSKAEDKK
jgi:hypothetical protein